MKNFLAIEIGGSKLQIFTGDERANILERRRFTVDATDGGAGIRRQIAAALQEILPELKPAAIGVGFGGPVDGRTGQVCCSHQVAGWHNFALGGWLHELTALPVFVENDSNAAALAEAARGAGHGHNPVFYFNLGSGVGGGLVVDGKIYHGAKPGEAEFGHLRLTRDGVTVEDRCSGWAVDEKIRATLGAAPGGLLARLCGEAPGGESRQLAAALAQHDPAADQILLELAEDLGFALSHVVHLFHPEIIVLGGGLSLVGEPLREAVEQALGGFVMEAFAPGPRVVLAGLGEDAVPVGALLLAQGLQP